MQNTSGQPAIDRFRDSIARIAAAIAGKPLDANLQAFLQQAFPPGSEAFDDLEQLIFQGIAEGWLCNRQGGGIAFGRALKPDGAAAPFSVDVVVMNDIRGPHHIHPTGEIGMVMPMDGAPNFDGYPRGWYVYPPGSAHFPTVRGGKAAMLYLLPQGAIEFTGREDAA